jgi:hypothetical protein
MPAHIMSFTVAAGAARAQGLPTKKCFLVFLMLVGSVACAQSEWLTVVGDANDATVNTVQVDPRPLSVNGLSRTMKLRVNRSATRVGREGVTYTSYEAVVVFECDQRMARYETVVYYMQPFWKGSSHKTSVYTKANPRMLQFLNVEPNPTARIIRAACETAGVTSS